MRTIIGIDPDVTASGVGVILIDDKGEKVVQMFKMPFGELLEKLSVSIPATIIIEDAWDYDKHNRHLSWTDNVRVASAKGLSIGRNMQVAKCIEDYLDYNQIPYTKIAPLKKHWKGTDGKITHSELENLLGIKLPRCNQDMRDALLIALSDLHPEIKVIQRRNLFKRR